MRASTNIALIVLLNILAAASLGSAGWMNGLHHQALQTSQCDALNENAIYLYYQARYDEALQEAISSLKCFQEAHDGAGEAHAYNNIAAAYERQGYYNLALENFYKGLELARANQNSDGESAALNGIAVIYQNQARFDKALETLQQALAIRQEAGDQEGIATILSNIGQVYRNQGAYPEALQAHQQAWAIFDARGDRVGAAKCQHNLGMVYRSLRQYPEALEAFTGAFNTFQELDDRADLANTYMGLGLIAADQKNFKEALADFYQAADLLAQINDYAGEAHALSSIGAILADNHQYQESVDVFMRALDALDKIRLSSGSMEGQAGYIGRYASVYRDTIRVLLKLGRHMEAFTVTERGRARSFLDSLASGHVQISDSEIPQLEQHGSFLTVEQAQSYLDEKTTLVSYWVLGEQGSLAFILQKDSFEMVELPQATSENLIRMIRAMKPAFGDQKDAHPVPFQQLSAWLMDPIAEYLTTSQLGIIPHQMLHYVPFSALTLGSKYITEDHQIFLLPSASVLPFIQKNSTKTTPTAQGAVIFGNPKSSESELPTLQAAENEARDISSLLNVASVSIYQDATESRLMAAAGEAGIIHLAAHGEFNVLNPLYSLIYLAPGDGQDGKLEVHEIYGMSLPKTQLVVLSACETNTPLLLDWQNQAVSPGDELVGFTRAFFYAGAPTVITSLWSVTDKQTRDLMVSFYGYWQKGMDKASAFQTAQADVREQYPNPFYWAGFALHGDPNGKFIAPQQPVVSTPGSDSVPNPICGALLLTFALPLLASIKSPVRVARDKMYGGRMELQLLEARKKARQTTKTMLPVFTGTFLLLTSTMAVEIVRRLWVGSPDIGSIFATLLILLITASPLVKQGREVIDKLLGLVPLIPKRNYPQVMFAAAVSAFTFVLVAWLVLLPALSIYYNEMGVKALNNRDMSGAQHYFVKATGLNPDQAIFYHNIAAGYQNMNQYSKAEEWYKKVIDYDSTYAPSYAGLSRVYNRVGNYELAAQTSLAGLKVIDSNIPHKTYDGVIWSFLQSPAPVENEQAQFTVSRYMLLTNLGWAYLGQEKPDLAQQALEEAIGMENELTGLEKAGSDPYREAASHYFLAQIYEDQEKFSEADLHWEEAVRYLKQNSWSDREWLLEINNHLTDE